MAGRSLTRPATPASRACTTSAHASASQTSRMLLVILRAAEAWAPDEALPENTAVVARGGRVLVQFADGSTGLHDADTRSLPSRAATEGRCQRRHRARRVTRHHRNLTRQPTFAQKRVTRCETLTCFGNASVIRPPDRNRPSCPRIRRLSVRGSFGGAARGRRTWFPAEQGGVNRRSAPLRALLRRLTRALSHLPG